MKSHVQVKMDFTEKQNYTFLKGLVRHWSTIDIYINYNSHTF